MSDDIWQSRDWVDHISFYVRTHLMRSTNLCVHDRNDITQLVLIHVWKNRDMYDPSLPLKPWLKTVAYTQVQNELRRQFSHVRNHIASRSRWLLRHPIPLLAKTVTHDDDGFVEEVIYEPDAIDPRTTASGITIEDLRGMSRREREVLTALLDCSSPPKIVRRKMKTKSVKGRTAWNQLQRLYKWRRRLQSIYRAALNE